MVYRTSYINNIIVLYCIPQAGEPRTERMSVSQDWTAVYPIAASFKPSAVPLPVRMGYPVKRGVPPEKKGNLELIKVEMSAFTDSGYKALLCNIIATHFNHMIQFPSDSKLFTLNPSSH